MGAGVQADTNGEGRPVVSSYFRKYESVLSSQSWRGG